MQMQMPPYFKEISRIRVTFRDEVLNDERFIKQVSHAKVLEKTYPQFCDDWQELARTQLERFCKFVMIGIVESLEISYYDVPELKKGEDNNE